MPNTQLTSSPSDKAGKSHFERECSHCRVWRKSHETKILITETNEKITSTRVEKYATSKLHKKAELNGLRCFMVVTKSLTTNEKEEQANNNNIAGRLPE